VNLDVVDAESRAFTLERSIDGVTYHNRASDSDGHNRTPLNYCSQMIAYVEKIREFWHCQRGDGASMSMFVSRFSLT
jgi:hypothetical protein